MAQLTMFAILAAVAISSGQDVTYATTSGEAYTLSVAIPTYTTSTTFTTSSSTSSTLNLPTTPYSGQSILTGTCRIPQYTPIRFDDGSEIEVPLVGCSDDRPECCPSLRGANDALTATESTSSPGAELTPTGIVALLNAYPLTVCPSDFVDIDPVCCPSGYSLYPQAIIGNTPCYTQLQTTINVPSGVLASISSQVAGTANGDNPTITQSQYQTSTQSAVQVSVIINQVFALGLPCAEKPNGLSVGEKAGIGAGVGVGVLLGLAFIWWCWAGGWQYRSKKPGTLAGPSIPEGDLYPMTPRLGLGERERKPAHEVLTQQGFSELAGTAYQRQAQNYDLQSSTPTNKHSSAVSRMSGTTAVGPSAISPSLSSPQFNAPTSQAVHQHQYQQQQPVQPSSPPLEFNQYRDSVDAHQTTQPAPTTLSSGYGTSDNQLSSHGIHPVSQYQQYGQYTRP